MTTHETKTYAGKPACAGSGTEPEVLSEYGNATCHVCGRAGLSLTPKRLITTHLTKGR